ncbi:MAG: adenylate kinase [Candidatus Berkelbacteria bacterium Gr01-1014_85]|uniref:Adenylate kinase n=1 Tax=Candidatus Berkelbacteria bacterium Gr01-1014_85 TaxID=2017150 RepID=A0A554JAM4_9BACT|nr:MAG: adenylate kinase [Candidatus Berkelbacteria bacterium Gr01-1014_85]
MNRLAFNIMGAQGSGKGTQARALLSKFKFNYFEIGAELRKIVAQGQHPQHSEIASLMQAGQRVPDSVVVGLLEQALTTLDPEQDWLFDSIMRSHQQLMSQITVFEQAGIELPTIIYLKLDRETALARIQSRLTCLNCGYSTINLVASQANDKSLCPVCQTELSTRHDDELSVASTRLDLFFKDTLPLIEEFRAAGKIIEIDAKPDIKSVTESLLQAIESHYQAAGLALPMRDQS